MTAALYKIVAFAITLGVLVVFHELGHYLVARLAGVKVLRFSIGFGRMIWSRRFGRDRTEWALSSIPLGGYVKMADEREAPVAFDDLPRAFNRQSVWRRIAIVVAGPLANLFLAGRARFSDIPRACSAALERRTRRAIDTLDDALAVDSEARDIARTALGIRP